MAKLIGVTTPDQHTRSMRSNIAAVLALLAALLVSALVPGGRWGYGRGGG